MRHDALGFGIMAVLSVLFGINTLLFLTYVVDLFQAEYGSVQTFDNRARIHFVVWNHPNPLEGNRTRLTFETYDLTTLHAVITDEQVIKDGVQMEFKNFRNGKYIESVGGVKQIPTEGLFWMLYQLRSYPDPRNPPTYEYLANKGVDQITVLHQDVFLLWLTTPNLDGIN